MICPNRWRAKDLRTRGLPLNEVRAGVSKWVCSASSLVMQNRRLLTSVSFSLCFSVSLAFACDSASEGAKGAAAAKAELAPVKDDASEAEKATDKPEADKAEAVEAPSAKLNLNTASKEEFMTIPDVGPRMAHEFDEYRPYVSIQQFRKEIAKYVDREQVTKFEAFVFVPVAVNDCDAETMTQLPELDDAKVMQLVAGRPYASNEDFLKEYEAATSAEARAKAEPMLVTK